MTESKGSPAGIYDDYSKKKRRKFGQLKKVSYLWRNKMRPVAVVIYFSEYSE